MLQTDHIYIYEEILSPKAAAKLSAIFQNKTFVYKHKHKKRSTVIVKMQQALRHIKLRTTILLALQYNCNIIIVNGNTTRGSILYIIMHVMH